MHQWALFGANENMFCDGQLDWWLAALGHGKTRHATREEDQHTDIHGDCRNPLAVEL